MRTLTPSGQRRPLGRSRAASVVAALAVTAGGLVAAGTTAILPAAEAAGAPAAADAQVDYWHGVNPVTRLTSDTFSEPPSTDKPWVRWNWVPATTTDEQLTSALDDMAAAGIGGVEIGQGGNPTNEQLTLVLTRANALGITVGLKYSGGAPTTWDTTSNYTRKTLTNSRTFVDAGATFSGAVPGTGTILAVEAYRCTATPCPTSGKRELDRSSVVNLTSTLTGTNTAGYFGGTTAGTLSWTAPTSPAGAQWVVVTFRQTQYQAAPETLSTQGTDALIAGYEAMWTPEIKALLEQNRSDLFVDSHTTDPSGVATELWSSNMAAAFQSQAGYAITPDLAALFYDDFTYSDKTDERVRTDFYQVRNDLFINNRIKPFTSWANTHGMTLRLQNEDPAVGNVEAPYQDQIDVGNALQRPEHESLAGADQIDIWRPLASANHMNGNPWYSTECCAVTPENYVDTLQSVETRMNKSFAAGITKLVYHVYPIDSSPTSTYPGYSNFGPASFAGSWGPRNPNWSSDAAAVNTWMSRNQQVLTQGKADMDVAVYLHSFEFPSLATTNTDGSAWGNRHWDDQALQRAGYTWDYLNPTLLQSKDATVKNGVLAADGPSYGALVVDSGINTPQHPIKTAMSVATAKRMLEYAEDGLPIIVVGAAPDQVEGAKGSDAELRAVVSDLLEQPSVTRVASEAGVPAKLAALGVHPDAKPATRSTLFSLHRSDAATDTDYYFLYNQGVDEVDTVTSRGRVYEEPGACRYTGASINPCRATGDAFDQEVTLKGSGTPYLLDAASGEITPISEYTTGEGTVTVRVALDRDASTIVALTGDDDRFATAAPGVHVVSTTADSAAYVDGRLVVRDTEPGTYTAVLSDGSTVSATIAAVPDAVDLTDATWQLAAEDWTPTNPVGTLGAAGSAVTRTPVALTLDGLAAWPDIPQLANASGVGTYSTSVTLPAGWGGTSSAILSLGQVVDTVQLTVNGTLVPIDQLTAKADIGRALVAGTNTITVRVSTTLNNRLSNLLPAVATRGVIQEYGLVGPVTLTPAGQAVAKDLDPDAPAVTTAPAVTGTVRVGSTVACTTGTWTGATSYAFAWSAGGKPVAGATTSRLRVPASAVGRALTCTVTATGPGGTATAVSAGRVVARGAALRNTADPRIRGKARVGRVLTATTGRWTPAATSYTYVWKVGGKRVATGQTYRVRSSARGKRVTVTVKASNPAYATGIAVSAPVKVRRK